MAYSAGMHDFNFANFSTGHNPNLPPDNISTPIGFVAAFISVVGFGCNLLPVKAYDMGDGMFFQWVLSSSIFACGFILNCILRFPKFYALAMVGGVMWVTGALFIVPIFRTIGIGLGFIIWGTFNIISGWTTGRFGMFGIKPQIPKSIAWNYAGLCVCISSAFIYFFIKTDVEPVQECRQCDQFETSTDIDNDYLFDSNEVDENRPLLDDINVSPQVSLFENMSPMKKKVIGISLSVISGILYGLSFTPVYYIMDNYKNASHRGLNYVFAHFAGIFGASNIYFLIYLLWRRKKVFINKRSIVPSCASGIIWAIAEGAWFVANEGLTEAVSFPIIASAPAALNALWGVILYKEIKGKSNLILLGIGFLMTTAGVIMTAVSKIV